jgi:hypothetical protein
VTAARKVLGWSKRRKLAHAFPWEHSYRRLKVTRRLGPHGVFLTCVGLRGEARAQVPGLLRRGTWARVTIDRFRHLALQTFEGQWASSNRHLPRRQLAAAEVVRVLERLGDGPLLLLGRRTGERVVVSMNL